MKTKEERFSEWIYPTLATRERQYLEWYKTDPKRSIHSLWQINQYKALQAYFFEKNLERTKQHWYVCGCLDVYLVEQFDDKLLGYALRKMSYTLLSDNLTLIERYANLTYSRYESSIASGWSEVFTNSVQLIIKDDCAGLECNLDIIRRKSLHGVHVKFLSNCYEYFVAMAERNMQKVKDTIIELLADFEEHPEDPDLIDEFYAMSAAGFVKLAWMKGLEIEIDNPLIPRDWLPVLPLASYDEGYDFLRQYFREEKLDYLI